VSVLRTGCQEGARPPGKVELHMCWLLTNLQALRLHGPDRTPCTLLRR
jgi:hypothetical protein